MTPTVPPDRSTHGLYVKAKPGLKLRDRKTTRLVTKVRAVMDWLQPSDMPALRAWAELEILAEQVFAVLRGAGVINRDGEARKLAHDYRLLRQAQLSFATQLGMTPASRMAIKADSTSAALDALSAAEERVAAMDTLPMRQKIAQQAILWLPALFPTRT